ncbi:MAG: VWA domain-containing protein [Lachnospiraceae bacterium]|nr:VWA domain-containing protein [Lachnospiraceae bacterium]
MLTAIRSLAYKSVDLCNSVILPSNYEVGFVAYNTSVCAQQTLLKNDERGQIMELADRVQYNGYSNAGAGLERAVELLEQSSAAKKDIVLLSDGEFLMADRL